MEKTKIVAPWIEYANQVEALFKEDLDIMFSYDDEEKSITLRVNGEEKADALTQLLPAEKKFGNVAVTITVIPANVTVKQIDLFRKAFSGNPAVSQTASVDTAWGTLNFVIFKPKVVQYYNDAMFDLNGIKTTVYEDLAREVFDFNDGIFFCTERAEE